MCGWLFHLWVWWQTCHYLKTGGFSVKYMHYSLGGRWNFRHNINQMCLIAIWKECLCLILKLDNLKILLYHLNYFFHLKKYLNDVSTPKFYPTEITVHFHKLFSQFCLYLIPSPWQVDKSHSRLIAVEHIFHFSHHILPIVFHLWLCLRQSMD